MLWSLEDETFYLKIALALLSLSPCCVVLFPTPTCEAHWEQHELQGQLIARWLQFVYTVHHEPLTTVLLLFFQSRSVFSSSPHPETDQMIRSVGEEIKHLVVWWPVRVFFPLPPRNKQKETQSLILLEGSNHKSFVWVFLCVWLIQDSLSCKVPEGH